MTREEARRLILALWRSWRQGEPERRADRAKFYGWLQTHRPELLAFPGLFDRRLHVSGWLLTDDQLKSNRRSTAGAVAAGARRPAMRLLGAGPDGFKLR